MINNTGKAILIWGIVVLLGWLGPYFLGMSVISVAMPYWSVLMVAALVATHFLIPNAWSNKTVQLWTVLVVAGMLENWLVTLGIIPATVMMFSYNHLWLLIGAIGFYLTTKTWKIPKSTKIYLTAAVLNAVLFVLYVLVADLKIDYPFGADLWNHRWLLMGLVQGVPIIMDALMNYNIPGKK